jgi:hypothetical protein
MHSSLSRIGGVRFTALALLALVVMSGAAAAQSGPVIGNIPGTSMSRDEFNARARAQLAALALNAVTYMLAGEDYNQDYYDLQASPAGNLGLKNMFTGRPVQAIFYDAPVDAMVSTPVADMPGAFDQLNPNAPAPPIGGPRAPVNPETGMGEWKATGGRSTGPLRVDPGMIRDYSGGDVYMYVRDELLQLIMFAPDGTYFERIDEIPNANYRENLQLTTGVAPDALYLAQVLYYLGNLAPQYSNLVRFMGNRETVPGAMFPTLPPAKRLSMSEEIGVTIRNPVTRRPIAVSATPSPGDIVDPSISGESLRLWNADGQAVSRAELTTGPVNREAAQPAPKPGKQKPAVRPGGKPKGGGAAPGGGRKPR